MEKHDVILTGIPRSGTTLLCYLLNKLPDTVALHEPMGPAKGAGETDPEAVCDQVARFFEDTRRSLLEDGTALSKHVRGRVPDNPKGEYPLPFRLLPNRFLGRSIFGRIALRTSRVTRGVVEIDKPLSSGFMLCIKQNGHFTGLLECLVHRHPCYAMVRNPLAILASWNSIRFEPRRGHVPAAERVNPELARELSRITDRFERQLFLLSWFFETYSRLLPVENVLIYEDVVGSSGTALQAITQRALEMDEALQNKNTNQLYNRRLMRDLGRRLLDTDGAFWRFYTRESVEQLLCVSG